ncbi:GSCOCG00009182001-RA-CDS [Cotesia congregata]|uniref:Similar to Dnttip2: Deoxynucleotidyltransferase terminal-interacting protein 2 (Mus musculus) n=1 Tax=Cotesia congregata TaxID=51543 RepID=A0A8J2H6F3_COTCN|nr:GSCOCG00009182001-RA-CDS [Cotesia congregata]CAG5078688.1 Similar to Dnttip2: Deoxynucleotidyltransferase terminal-interacting protein 2 (Mus musculus) [Cotesia congregata]
MNFIIDTQGATNLAEKSSFIDSDDEFDIENLNVELPETSTSSKKSKKSAESVLESLDSFMGWTEEPKKSPSLVPDVSAPLNTISSSSSSKEVDDLLKKSVVQPGFEKLESVPRYDESRRRLTIQRKKEREKTKGTKWFNMPAPEMTAEVRHDLQVIQMRSALDPKRFYKKNDIKALPKYFQIGKVVDSPLDYYSGRLSNKERKKTLVDELMADAEFAKYNKRKFKEIVKENPVGMRKAHAHAKRLKKRK